MLREELNRALPGALRARELQPARFPDGYRWVISDGYAKDTVGCVDFDNAGQLLRVHSWNDAVKKRILKSIERFVALKQAFEAGYEAAGGDDDAACVAAWQEAWPNLRGSISNE